MINLVVSALLFPGFIAPVNPTGCPAGCQLEQVSAYFRTLDRVFQEGSTRAEIEALFSLLHDEVRYVHADYEADFQKEAWKAAFIGNLERGAYRNGMERQIGIMTVIHGKDAIAVEYSHGEVQPDGSWRSGEPLLAVFRFRDGKIAHIEELW